MDKSVKVILLCVFLGFFQSTMVARDEQNFVGQHTAVKADYVPFVICTAGDTGYIFPTTNTSEERSPFKNPSLYVLYKTNNGSINAKEYIIRRYAGSAVLKNPYFMPAAGFHPIARHKETDPTPPLLIQRYAQFIHTLHLVYVNHRHNNPNSLDSFTRLFFYADADEVAKLRMGYWERFINYFYSQPKEIHPLVKSLQNDTLQKQNSKIPKIDESEFEVTNIFVDEAVTLNELQEQLNKNIQLINGMYYIKDPNISSPNISDIPNIFRR